MSKIRSSSRYNSSVVKEIDGDSDDRDNAENVNYNSRANMSKVKCSAQKEKTSSELEKSSTKRKSRRASPIEDVEVSPPKSRKAQVPETLFSPSRLIDRLSIEDSSDEEIEEIQEKSQPARNKYQNARKVLNSAETDTLPGREKELEELNTFLEDHLNELKSGSLYVSGQPGTGKTACLSKILKSKEIASKFVKVYINCTSISTIGSIYKKICTELNLTVSGKTEKQYQATIEKYLIGKHKMILMVLDEIDQLVGNKQSILYTIFEWPAKHNSKLILIGIANSLDLTDRILSRLNAKCDLKPKLMHFAPYTKEQIVDIFKSRLEDAGVFPPVTIQLLAAKVAAVSGDVRRALDIGRRVIEIAERQKKQKKKLNIAEIELEASLSDANQDTVPLNLVVNVLKDVYGASQNLNDDIEDTFPLQQKILICCLLLILTKDKNKDITIGRLHDVYKKVCSKKNILAVEQSEFVGLCLLVETHGIVRVLKKKEPRLSKVVLQWDEEEVSAALKDKQLIAEILQDISCLKK